MRFRHCLNPYEKWWWLGFSLNTITNWYYFRWSWSRYHEQMYRKVTGH